MNKKPRINKYVIRTKTELWLNMHMYKVRGIEVRVVPVDTDLGPAFMLRCTHAQVDNDGREYVKDQRLYTFAELEREKKAAENMYESVTRLTDSIDYMLPINKYREETVQEISFDNL